MKIMLLCTALLTTPALAAIPVPDCAGKVEISHAPIMRVEKNGALILTDGRAALLEGIRLPQGAADHAPGYFADEALAALTDMAKAVPLDLASTPPKQDRYDRVRVQAFGTAWLNVAMLEKGLARVAIAPDRQECFPELYGAEQRARANGAGIWGSPAYRIRASAVIGVEDAGSFQIVEGRIAHVDARPGRAIIDFGNDPVHGFSVVIAPEDRKAFRDLDPALADLGGRRVRVRGLVQNYNGRPQIQLSNPVQIELLH